MLLPADVSAASLKVFMMDKDYKPLVDYWEVQVMWA